MRHILLLLLLALLQCGCGTFSDAFCGPITDDVYFRGVGFDLRVVQEGRLFMAADIPFSAIADTMLVPLQAYYQFTDQPSKKIESNANESLK